MRRTATITTGVAVAMLGGGMTLALSGYGTASAAKAHTTPPAASPSSSRTASPTASPSASPTASPSAGEATEISLSEAQRIALRTVPEGRVRSIELEREHGTLVWDVDVTVRGVERDLDIDARTGNVVRDKTGLGHDETRHGTARPGTGTARPRPDTTRPGTATTEPWYTVDSYPLIIAGRWASDHHGVRGCPLRVEGSPCPGLVRGRDPPVRVRSPSAGYVVVSRRTRPLAASVISSARSL